MPSATDTDILTWNAGNVANLMYHNNIRSRYALARKLDIAKSVINSSFDDAWQGQATAYLIARMTSAFRVPIGHLVIEPATMTARATNGQKR